MTFIRPLLTTLCFVSLLSAQDVVSGPDVGKRAPKLVVFDATGPDKNKEVDQADQRKQKPTVYVFIQADKWDRPMARFLRTLDDALQKEDDALTIAVWLTETPDKTKDYLPLAQQSLKLQRTTLTCYTQGQAGPKDWNINADAHLTAVIANKGQVAAVFGYRSINETDVPAVRDAYRKAIKKK